MTVGEMEEKERTARYEEKNQKEKEHGTLKTNVMCESH